jgi:hypothetical protein
MIDGVVIKRVEESKSADDLAKILWQLLSSGISVWENEDGSEIFCEIKALVDHFNGLKIEIPSREHAPPHFHVIYGNQSASYSIENGDLIEGNFGNREKKVIKHYYKYAKNKIIKVWNETRPSDCLVGKYTEKENEPKNILYR